MTTPQYRVIGPEHPDSVIFVLHGWGEAREQLQEYGNKFSERFPTSAIVLPEGPERVQNARIADGLGWGTPDINEPLTEHDRKNLNPILTEEFNKTASINLLHNLYDEVLQKYGLDASHAAVFGFSEGGVMAMHSTLSYGQSFKAVVAHSAQFYGMKPEDQHARPGLLYIYGSDEGFPNTPGSLSFDSAYARVHALTSDSTPQEIDGLKHAVSDHSLEQSFQFIENKLNAPAQNSPGIPGPGSAPPAAKP